LVKGAKKEKFAPGHSVAENRLTLLIGGIAAGDLELKHMLV
jgi:hypothetical protein